jgi:hypothetical protein
MESAHCWRVWFKDGSQMDIAREVICKPISLEEAKRATNKLDEIISIEPISLKQSYFWN